MYLCELNISIIIFWWVQTANYEMRWKFTIATTTVALVTIIVTVATAITTHVTHMIFRHFDYWLFFVEAVVTSYD